VLLLAGCGEPEGGPRYTTQDEWESETGASITIDSSERGGVFFQCWYGRDEPYCVEWDVETMPMLTCGGADTALQEWRQWYDDGEQVHVCCREEPRECDILILRHDGRRLSFTVPGAWDEYHPRTIEEYHQRFGKRGWEAGER
jgi:hypothetical protein